jgi:pyruvate formate lyase activating enzyme
MTLTIKGFNQSSFLDWDGKIVSTLYVGNCNFKCPFCHNSGLVESPQDYDTIDKNYIEEHLLERKDFIDGICLTGGEPCVHKNNGLADFLKRIKELGFKVKLDSNGFDPDCLKKLFNQKLVDYIAMDIKGPLNQKYDTLSGVKVDLDKIKSSIEMIINSGIDYEFRTTVVPTLLDIEDIESIAQSIRGAKKFVLQQFVAKNCWDKSLQKVKPYPKDKIDGMIATAKKYVENTTGRGV